MAVAQASIDTLLSPDTGHVYDLRKLDPFAGAVFNAEGG
jgi:hypothetical protein